jgi:hypothetical protein
MCPISKYVPTQLLKSRNCKQRCIKDWSIIIYVIISGVGLSPLRTAATSGLLYKPHIIDEGDYGAIVGMKIGRGNRSSRKKPAPAPLCPPQIPHDQTRALTRAAVVGSQRLTKDWSVYSYEPAVGVMLHYSFPSECNVKCPLMSEWNVTHSVGVEVILLTLLCLRVKHHVPLGLRVKLRIPLYWVLNAYRVIMYYKQDELQLYFHFKLTLFSLCWETAVKTFVTTPIRDNVRNILHLRP